MAQSSTDTMKRKKSKKADLTKKVKTTDHSVYGSCNDMTILYNHQYVTLQKKGSTFRLYASHLTALQLHLMEYTTAIQDQITIEKTLKGQITVSVCKYQGSGLYVELSRPLEDQRVWTMRLKMPEFMFLLDHLDSLQSLLRKTPISSNDLYESAVQAFVGLAENELIKLTGGKLVNISELDQYVPEAIAAVTLDNFTDSLQRFNCRLIVSSKMLYTLCRSGDLFTRVQDTLRIPHVLNFEIQKLTSDI